LGSSVVDANLRARISGPTPAGSPMVIAIGSDECWAVVDMVALPLKKRFLMSH
jgi:hypothetical protein